MKFDRCRYPILLLPLIIHCTPTPQGYVEDADEMDQAGGTATPDPSSKGGSSADPGEDDYTNPLPDADPVTDITADASLPNSVEPDASAGDSHALDDASTAPPGLIPAFIAIGRGGRRTLSCDDGITWTVPCTTDGIEDPDCQVDNNNQDHSAWASQGIAYGNGAFVAIFGWFGTLNSAQILRTSNGHDWITVMGGSTKTTGTFATEMAYGNGVFVANAQRSASHISSDNGLTWRSTWFAGEGPHRRTMIFIPFGPGRFISYGDYGRVTWSDDNGDTWKVGTHSCPHVAQLAWGAGVLVASNADGRCVSSDGGLTWSVFKQSLGWGGLVFTGDSFYISAADRGLAYVSPDGFEWRTVAVKGSFTVSRWPAVIATNGAGTIVGINGGSGYFRSTDNGRSFVVANGPTGNTNVTDLEFGYITASSGCGGD